MNKLLLIIGREIKSKITNKTFIIMTILAPVLITGFMAFVIKMSQAERTEQKVLVIDETHLFEGKLVGNDFVSITYSNERYEKMLDKFSEEGYTCLLWVTPNFLEGGDGSVKVFFKKSPGFAFQTYIRGQMEKIIYEQKLKANNIDPTVITNARQKVKLVLEKIDDKGRSKEQSSFELFGFFSGAFMMIFILMYGMMVFRSVMEEKTNRIVEVIISSVKPFQLMMGKIIGVAILGTMQFIVMGLTTLLLTTLLSGIFLKDIKTEMKRFDEQQEMVKKQGITVDFTELEKFDGKLEMFEVLKKIEGIDFTEVFICFLLYFIGGYLFYSSLLAAIGSFVDSETDSQQFMMPVMLPLMAGYFISTKTILDPDSTLVFWGSMIPFTSPIVMMSRITSGVPLWEILLSITILYISFVGTVWLSGKIYRTGILMYGKKTTWREVFKWLRY